jgi:hypothetical protein
MIATLLRTYQQKQTKGVFSLFDKTDVVFCCKMLEPDWAFNMPFLSCIPEGVYLCEKHLSPTYGDCIQIKNVPGRTDILIHWGNYRDNTEGCLLSGEYFKDINKDGLKDVINSQKAFNNLMQIAPEYFYLIIASEQESPNNLISKFKYRNLYR